MQNLSGELASLQIDRRTKTRPMWRRATLVGLLVTIPAAATFYFVSGRVPKRKFGIVRPTVQTSGTAVGTPVLTASGYLAARRQAVVSAKIQGRLAELNVEEGSHLQEGQLIARLDSADYEAQVEVARTQVQRAEVELAEQRRELRLTQELAQNAVASRDQLESAISRVRASEAALSQSKASLVLSQASLQNTFIRAPFTGVVVKKMAEVGESVAPIPAGVNLSTSSGAIVAMADMATLEAEVDVSESNVAKLKQGQPAEVSVEAFPEHVYRARLRQVLPTADRTKATVTVKVTILEADRNLNPEMSVKVTFLEQAKSRSSPSAQAGRVILVPKDSVVSRDGASVVFEVRDEIVRAVPVVVGAEYQDDVIIKQGLTGSETLVAHPPNELKDGDHLRVGS